MSLKTNSANEIVKLFVPELQSRMIFLFLFGIPFFGSIVQILRNKMIGDNLTLALGLFATLIFLLIPQIWFAGQKIILYTEKIVFRKWFFIRQEILLNHITKAKVCVGISRSAKGYYRFELNDDNRYSTSPFIINIKPYSSEALKTIAKAIIEKAPNVKANKSFKSFAEGNGVEQITKTGILFLWRLLNVLIIIMLLIALIRIFIF